MKKILRVIIYIFAFIGFAFLAVYGALQIGLLNEKGIIDNQHDFYKNQIADGKLDQTWKNSEEWQVLKSAILKDKEQIDRASGKTGIPSRLIVSVLIVEQLRLFHSEREVFKQVFAPLKMLGNQSQFSWGVMGIKQDTAKEIENHLKNKNSDYYLGPEYEHFLDYSVTSTPTSTSNSGSTSTSDENSVSSIDSQRFARLTDEKDRYYSYLYGALFIKEIEAQWKKAGFPIQDKPEILATLFNIGFGNSRPNANPQFGGAEIEMGTATYSFGGLAGAFYYSEELIQEFPH
jgi:hypothetical protein